MCWRVGTHSTVNSPPERTRRRDVLPAFCNPIMVTSISVALCCVLVPASNAIPAHGNFDGVGSILTLTKTSAATNRTPSEIALP